MAASLGDSINERLKMMGAGYGPHYNLGDEGEVFCGMPIKTLPVLRRDGLTFMSGKVLMERCLYADVQSRANFRKNFVYIALFNVKDPDSDEVKMVLANSYPDLLDRINPGARLTADGGLPLTADEYQALEGFKFDPEVAWELQRNLPYVSSISRLIEARFWEEKFAEGDARLTEKFRYMVSHATFSRCSSGEGALRVHPSLQEGVRLCSARGMGPGDYEFHISGNTSLDYPAALVGITPRTRKPLEKRV